LTYDLGCFSRYERNSPINKVSFLNGYEKVRPLNQIEKTLLPYFEVLMRVFHLGARAINADGVRNSKWLMSDMEETIRDIDMQLSKIINENL
jgi:Ser/Thr protein kinase RdoA (MazF antagonist)